MFDIRPVSGAPVDGGAVLEALTAHAPDLDLPSIVGLTSAISDVALGHRRVARRSPMNGAGSEPTSGADSMAACSPGADTGERTPDAAAGVRTSGADLVDVIGALERLKAAACAAQARLAADLDRDQRAAQRASGLPASRQGAGVAAQIALARGQSPSTGQTLLGMAKALTTEMPHTLGALASGVLDEWRATVLVRESACLDVADRELLDREVCGDHRALVGVGARALAAQARRVSQRLDAAALVRRARRAEAERCVTIRPAPDTMVYLTALLPVVQGVGVYASLVAASESARASGDVRSKGQVMADTLVERLSGQPTAAAVPLQVNLVMTDAALLGPPGSPGHDEPAHLPGHGPVPASWARELVDSTLADANANAHANADALVWVRRLFTHPTSGQLVGLESRARSAPVGLRDFIALRDDTCRTPWCDAPIRHHDHVTDHARGGATTSSNLQGLCEACNYAKSAPGWRATTALGGSALGGSALGSESVPSALGRVHTVTTTAPTGHRYASASPPLPGAVVVASESAGRPLDIMRPGDLAATVSAIEAFLARQLAERALELLPHHRT